MPQAKHCHLPDVLYGGIAQVADMIDELGSEASITELSCAIVNVCRVAAQHEKTIAKLTEDLAKLSALAVVSSERIGQLQKDSAAAFLSATRELVKRIEALERVTISLR